MIITPWLLFAAAASVSWEASNHKAMWNCYLSSFCRVIFYLTNIPTLTKFMGDHFFLVNLWALDILKQIFLIYRYYLPKRTKIMTKFSLLEESNLRGLKQWCHKNAVEFEGKSANESKNTTILYALPALIFTTFWKIQTGVTPSC